jgi:hypothetical protein
MLICLLAVDQNRDEPMCGSTRTGLRPLILLLPAWFRFAQCLRRFRDSNWKLWFSKHASKMEEKRRKEEGRVEITQIRRTKELCLSSSDLLSSCRFPHMTNAAKYSTTFLVVIFSSLAAREKGACKL